MSYCEDYYYHHHLSLVVKTQSETYIQQVLTCPAEKSWQTRSSSTTEKKLIFILVLSLARSRSLFSLCFCSSSVFSVTWAMVGHVSALLLLSVLCQVFTVWAWSIWPGESRRCTCVRGGGLTHNSDWHFSDTLLGSDWLYWVWGFWQIRLVPLGGATADLYVILLSHHNDNLVTDFCIKALKLHTWCVSHLEAAVQLAEEMGGNKESSAVVTNGGRRKSHLLLVHTVTVLLNGALKLWRFGTETRKKSEVAAILSTFLNRILK